MFLFQKNKFLFLLCITDMFKLCNNKNDKTKVFEKYF